MISSKTSMITTVFSLPIGGSVFPLYTVFVFVVDLTHSMNIFVLPASPFDDNYTPKEFAFLKQHLDPKSGMKYCLSFML